MMVLVLCGMTIVLPAVRISWVKVSCVRMDEKKFNLLLPRLLNGKGKPSMHDSFITGFLCKHFIGKYSVITFIRNTLSWQLDSPQLLLFPLSRRHFLNKKMALSLKWGYLNHGSPIHRVAIRFILIFWFWSIFFLFGVPNRENYYLHLFPQVKIKINKQKNFGTTCDTHKFLVNY